MYVNLPIKICPAIFASQAWPRQQPATGIPDGLAFPREGTPGTGKIRPPILANCGINYCKQ